MLKMNWIDEGKQDVDVEEEEEEVEWTELSWNWSFVGDMCSV